ncbi:procyclic acidic repetitive family protein [Corynebacterium sp. CCM 9185]|uniref:Uncharacterized protein n=1 Tax=Corynebacterium marambiense TaxID=2765364 RepID=A0ABS0VRM6_9CORY|nr:hypothetical protein [Corynebacterium marambiense]MBI8999438.1 hypothetical protein [Corynebacterium marambiense]MCK7662276.1 procyclic acidic repetitive family protein [Corynebacterium marambiense]MCX7541544.1 procyclic acidic repetitive family protein [Corynebacterium marambiense]
MKGTPSRSRDADDADAGLLMLDGAVEDYRTVVEELCSAARGAWTGPQVTPEELAETTGTIRSFDPAAVLNIAAAAGGLTGPDPVGDQLAEVISELGDEGIGKLIGDQLGAVVADCRDHRMQQEQVLYKAARAMSANATLCRMSGEAAGVTARATLSAIRAQAHMIDEAYLDEDWDCFRQLVGAAATLVDECAREIWELCVDRDETMCEGLNHLMTSQAAVAEAPPAPLTPAAEELFDSAARVPRWSCPDGVAGSPGPVLSDAPGSGIDPLPCVGILGAVGIGTALIGAGLIAGVAHGALEHISCGEAGPDVTEPPDFRDPSTEADKLPEPAPPPESTAPVGEPLPEPEASVSGHETPRLDSSPEPAPATDPEPKLDGGYPSGKGTPGAARKAGQW